MTRKIFGICILIGCIVLSFRESCPAPTCHENPLKGCSSKKIEGLLACNRDIHMKIFQRDNARNEGLTLFTSPQPKVLRKNRTGLIESSCPSLTTCEAPTQLMAVVALCSVLHLG